MKNNPLLATLKENDIVVFELHSSERSAIKQICRIYDLEFKPACEKHAYDWLEFKSEVLYTNIRLHKSMLSAAGNCMAIIEILPKERIGQYARLNDMWKSDEFLMSDAELEVKRMRLPISY